MDPKTEQAHLQLLSDMRAELAAGLAGIPPAKLTGINLYLSPMCFGLSDVSAGFVTLQKAGNEHASRVLIRTAIETALKLSAVYEHPPILYRIAYTEHVEDGKFLKAADESKIVVTPELHAAKWAKAGPVLASLFPGEALKDETVSAYDLARLGKMPYLYDFHFRLYCNYTHATLRAHSSPNHFLPEVDYTAVESALYVALVVARNRLGADCPNVKSYTERVKALTPAQESPPS